MARFNSVEYSFNSKTRVSDTSSDGTGGGEEGNEEEEKEEKKEEEKKENCCGRDRSDDIEGSIRGPCGPKETSD